MKFNNYSEFSQSSSFWCKVAIGKQSSPLNIGKPKFGPPDCKINIYPWIEKGVYHHEKWLSGNKTSSSLATCMSTFHSHGHEYVCLKFLHFTYTRWVFSFHSFLKRVIYSLCIFPTMHLSNIIKYKKVLWLVIQVLFKWFI